MRLEGKNNSFLFHLGVGLTVIVHLYFLLKNLKCRFFPLSKLPVSGILSQMKIIGSEKRGHCHAYS
jgi:hypothetical protein